MVLKLREMRLQCDAKRGNAILSCFMEPEAFGRKLCVWNA